jgi:hypothetical protein
MSQFLPHPDDQSYIANEVRRLVARVNDLEIQSEARYQAALTYAGALGECRAELEYAHRNNVFLKEKLAFARSEMEKCVDDRHYGGSFPRHAKALEKMQEEPISGFGGNGSIEILEVKQ